MPKQKTSLSEKINGRGIMKDYIWKDDAKQKINDFIDEVKEKMDEEKEFCEKAGVLPSIHPRRVKTWIDKLALTHFGDKILGKPKCQVNIKEGRL